MKKKDDKDDWDDGRTIAPMNGDELPSYRRFFGGGSKTAKKAEKEKIDLTKKERRAAFKAGLLVMLPHMAMIIGGFLIAGLLVWLWLR